MSGRVELVSGSMSGRVVVSGWGSVSGWVRVFDDRVSG